MTVRVPLSRGMFALIDDEDAERVLALRWHAQPGRNGRWYAKRTYLKSGKYTKIGMHRFILLPPACIEVDHIDGDGLNNTRQNLRLSTRAQNSWNTGARSHSRTGLKGVSVHPGAFHAAIAVRGKSTFLGRFKTAEEAARAYDAAARVLHGEFAFLNYPVEAA